MLLVSHPKFAIMFDDDQGQQNRQRAGRYVRRREFEDSVVHLKKGLKKNTWTGITSPPLRATVGPNRRWLMRTIGPLNDMTR